MAGHINNFLTKNKEIMNLNPNNISKQELIQDLELTPNKIVNTHRSPSLSIEDQPEFQINQQQIKRQSAIYKKKQLLQMQSSQIVINEQTYKVSNSLKIQIETEFLPKIVLQQNQHEKNVNNTKHSLIYNNKPQQRITPRNRFKRAVNIISFWNYFKKYGLRKKLQNYQKQQNYLKMQFYKRYAIFPLQPDGNFKYFWNISLFFMIIMTAIITPFRICFIDDKDDFQYQYIDLFFDSFFGFDILINFISSYYDEKNQLVFTLKDIILNYLKGYFLLDFISVFPIEQISEYIDTSLIYNRLFRLLRLPRLNRLSKIIKLQNGGNHSFMNQVFQIFRVNLGYQKVFNISVVILLMLHLSSCFYYLIARIHDFNQETWVGRQQLADKSYFTRYISAFYWSLQTLTTIGYGETSGVPNMDEQMYAIFWMIVGVGFYSRNIGNMATLIREMNQDVFLLDNILNQIEDITNKCFIPLIIQLKLIDFIETNYKENDLWGINLQAYKEQFMHQQFEEIGLIMKIDMISSIMLFKIDIIFTSYLFPQLYIYKLIKDEMLFREGDPKEEVFFLLSGQMTYLNSEGHELLSIDQGEILGDIEIIMDTKRQYFLATKSEVVLLVCKTNHFQNLLQQHPLIQKYLQKLVKIKQTKIYQQQKYFQSQTSIRQNQIQTPSSKNKFQNIYSRFHNNNNWKEEQKRIQNFSNLYMIQQQQQIYDGNSIHVLKNSREHYKLLLERLKYDIHQRRKMEQINVKRFLRKVVPIQKDQPIYTSDTPSCQNTQRDPLLQLQNSKNSFFQAISQSIQTMKSEPDQSESELQLSKKNGDFRLQNALFINNQNIHENKHFTSPKMQRMDFFLIQQQKQTTTIEDNLDDDTEYQINNEYFKQDLENSDDDLESYKKNINLRTKKQQNKLKSKKIKIKELKQYLNDSKKEQQYYREKQSLAYKQKIEIEQLIKDIQKLRKNF